MSVELAGVVLGLLGLYLGLGILFAVAFHARGLARVDAVAARSNLGFRVVITPGVVALWPLLARRWRAGARVPPAPRDAHRDAARAGTAR